MDKVRITLRLDADVAAALKKKAEGSSLSAAASDALRDALGVDDGEAHRRAGLSFIEEMYTKYGRPTPEQYARAEQFVAEVMAPLDRDYFPSSEKSTSPDKGSF